VKAIVCLSESFEEVGWKLSYVWKFWGNGVNLLCVRVRVLRKWGESYRVFEWKFGGNGVKAIVCLSESSEELGLKLSCVWESFEDMGWKLSCVWVRVLRKWGGRWEFWRNGGGNLICLSQNRDGFTTLLVNISAFVEIDTVYSSRNLEPFRVSIFLHFSGEEDSVMKTQAVHARSGKRNFLWLRDRAICIFKKTSRNRLQISNILHCTTLQYSEAIFSAC